MSTPPVLSKVSGNCSSYEPECIGDTQRILFYSALPLLAAGVAGHMVSMTSFFLEQFPSIIASVEEGGFKISMVCTASAANLVAYAVTVFAVLGHPYIKPWSLHFGIPAVVTLVATLVLLSGSSTYTYARPRGSLVTMVMGVFVASASKLFHHIPADPNALHEAQAHGLNDHRTRGLRCLNKAAIVLPDQSLEEQEKSRWKLCTVGEVEVLLAWGDMLVTYTLWTLTVYLTDVWKLSFTHAAAIMNIYYGSIGILHLIIGFIVDTLVGNSPMLLRCSCLALCTGMGFLSMSTPPVLSKSTGTCGSYEPECVGDTQRILFYTGLTLTAVGMAGHVVSLDGYLRDQPGDWTTRYIIVHAGFVGVYEIFIYEFLGFPYFIKPWSLQFGFPAICILVATTLYLCARYSYTYVRPQGSIFTTVVRVFVASASKLFHRQPADPSLLHEMANLSIHRTRGLRFLNKSAIVLPNQSVEEQQKNKWKLCTVTEVESTKLIVTLIPLSTSFVLLGLLSTLMYTFFVEQSKRLNKKWTAKITFPTLPLALTLLLWLYAGAKLCFPAIYITVFKKIWSTNVETISPAVGLMVSMLLGLLCCVTAAGVESHRLGVVKSHGLVNKPDESIPMSVYWLVPQFLFLGCAAGMLETSAANFSDKYSTPFLSNYMHAVCCAAHSVGCVGSIAVVHVLGKVKPSWFQDTINQSRLDSYYWFLSCLCAINIVWYYVVLRCFYAWRNTGEASENNSPESCCSCSFYFCFQRCCCFC